MLRKYIRQVLDESYNDVGVDVVKRRPKLSEVLPKIAPQDVKVLPGITLVHIQYDKSIIDPYGEITAYDNTDGTEVGNASYSHSYEGGPLHGTIDVRPDKRRQKLGTEMYKFIEEITAEKIHPDIPNSKSAQAFWSQPNRPFGMKQLRLEIRRILSDTENNEDYTIVYRGQPKEYEGDSPHSSIWVSPDEDFAAEYGDVIAYTMPNELNLLEYGFDDFEELAHEFGDADPEEYIFEPPEEFIELAKSKGYDGFQNEDNILIFDKSKLTKI